LERSVKRVNNCYRRAGEFRRVRGLNSNRPEHLIESLFPQGGTRGGHLKMERVSTAFRIRASESGYEIIGLEAVPLGQLIEFGQYGDIEVI